MMTAAEIAETFFEQIDPFLADLDEGMVVSQDRVVDRLLDLYNSTTNPVLRQEISDVLSDIRHVTSVETDEMRMQVRLLAACAAVETAVEALAA